MKQSMGEKIFNVANIAVLSLLGFVTLYPFWYVTVISLHDSAVSSYYSVFFWPGTFTLNNFKVVLVNDVLVNGFMITVARTVVGAVSSVFISGMLAYGLSKKYLIGRSLFLNLIIFTMFFGGGLIPFYLLLKKIYLLNTFWVYVVPALLNAWNVFIMKTYFSGLPEGIEESAKIDGANDLVVYIRIVLPMAMPLLATMLLFSAVGHWNDWVSGELFVFNPDLLPVQTILMHLLARTEANNMILQTMNSEFLIKSPSIESVKMAAIVITTIPIIMVYPFLQKYFAKGVMIGSIKG